MAELITLSAFGAEKQHYHIYRIQNSTVAHHTHYHDYYQVCFVTRGQIHHRQEGTVVSLGPGDAFIIPPGFSHSIHFLDAYSEIYSLSFTETLLRSDDPQSGAQRFLRSLRSGSTRQPAEPVRLRVMLDEQRQEMLKSLMDCLLRQKEMDCPPEISAASSLITSILYLLAQSYYAHPQNAPALKGLTASRSALRRCLEYIDTHYRQPLSVTEISRLFGVSRSAFCAGFPQVAGMPFQKYIAQKRILEAQMLIRTNPGWTLSRIAGAVGYEDDSTFYRNFLRIAGVSPSDYRELCLRHREGS